MAKKYKIIVPKPAANDEKGMEARNDKGQLVGDDPSTPDVNEAWEGGEAPKKKAVKKTTKKKSTKKKS